MATKSGSKSSNSSKTQTYPSAKAAIAGAQKRGESSVTFKLPTNKKK